MLSLLPHPSSQEHLLADHVVVEQAEVKSGEERGDGDTLTDSDDSPLIPKEVNVMVVYCKAMILTYFYYQESDKRWYPWLNQANPLKEFPFPLKVEKCH